MPVSGIPIFNGLAPKNGPRALAYNPVMVQNVAQDFDLTQEQDTNDLEFVQSIWIDNRNNAGAFQIDVNGVPFSLVVPAQTVGVYPFYHSGHIRMKLTALGVMSGNNIVPLIFFNVPQAFFTYKP